MSQPLLHVVLMGAPGAGNSTQSLMIKARYSLYVLETGQLLRDEVNKRTALGLLAEGYFKPADQGCLLDGFPRTIPQAEALDGLLHQLRRPLTAVISLTLSDDEAIHRLGGRRMCVGLDEPFPVHIDDKASVEACKRLGGQLVRRPDDVPEVIVERLRTYEAATVPLLDYYRKQGVLHVISAAAEPEAVHLRIVQLLDQLTTSNAAEQPK